MQWQHIPIMKAVAWFDDPGAAAAVHASGLIEAASGAPDLAWVDAMTRRRLSRIARAVFDCAGRCQTGPGDLRLVVASRHGEVARTLSQLENLASGEALSPTAFSLSVHNATAGLLSIIRGNRAPISAVAAGEETFGWGLLDAYAAHAAAPESPVLYLYADDALPAELAEFSDTSEKLMAIGMLISSDAPHRLDIRAGAASTARDERSLPASFTASGAEGCWNGGRMRFEWRWDGSESHRVH
jgi:hypothetical protein